MKSLRNLFPMLSQFRAAQVIPTRKFSSVDSGNRSLGFIARDEAFGDLSWAADLNRNDHSAFPRGHMERPQVIGLAGAGLNPVQRGPGVPNE